MALRNWLRPGSTNRSRNPLTRGRARLGVQWLEDRSVPAAGLVSAFTIDGEASQARDIAVDAAGNSYLTGFFNGVTDFDPAHVHPGDADILTPRGNGDIFVAKITPDNSLVWVRRAGGDVDSGSAVGDTGEGIEVDAGGNVYVTGRFLGAADFGPTTLTAASNYEGFLAKYDAAGAMLWARQLGTSGGYEVDVDGAGNAYVLATGSGHTILKFSPAGGSVWSKTLNTNTSQASPDLIADAAGNVFVTGGFTGTVDFDPGPKTKYLSAGPYPYTDTFVLKLTSAGNLGWASQFAGRVSGSTRGFSYGNSIAIDGGGNVVVGGSYLHEVDFNPGSGTTLLPTTGGAFVIKLSGSGSLVWAKALAKSPTVTSAWATVYDLAVDAAGSIYGVGSFSGSIDFNPGAGTHIRPSNGSNDIFVVKLTSAGNFAWAETFGGTGHEIGWAIAVDPAGVVYLVGSYQGTVDFDPDPLVTLELTTTGTQSNLFFIRLTQP